MDLDYYLDERPDDDSSSSSGGGGGDGSWGGGDGGGSGGGGSGGGWGNDGNGGGSGNDGNWGNDSNDEEDENQDLSLPQSEFALKLTFSGRLMLCDGVASCAQVCEYIPAILAYIDGTEENQELHANCILIELEYTNLTGDYSYSNVPVDKDWEFDDDAENKPVYLGGFPLPEVGEILTIKAKWQEGHYNIAAVHSCMFSILGVDTAWHSYGLSEFETVAVITVDEDSIIRVNSSRGYLAGNKEKLA